MKGKVSQWEVVEVNFQMPDGRFLPHPALVVSNDELFLDEEFFYAVLMTIKNYFQNIPLKLNLKCFPKYLHVRDILLPISLACSIWIAF